VQNHVRGKIHHPGRYRQLVDYSGLQFERGITPTDIDGVLDFNGRLFIFLEFKHGDAPLPFGQRLALQRLCDGLIRPHIQAAVILARHDDPVDREVMASKAIVSEYRWFRRWRKPQHQITVLQAIEKIRSMPF
jgi:hypothetical protein